MPEGEMNMNKGFSLIELIVALLITSILFISAGSVYLIAVKTYTRAGDISFKEGSVTNIETELQNYLSVASKVELLTQPKKDSSVLNIGFDPDGNCVEHRYKGSDQFEIYQLDQIANISLKVTQVNTGDPMTLEYELVPNKSMSTLKAGIVMNNSNMSSFALSSQLVVNGGAVSLKENKPLYLVVTPVTK